MTEDRHLANERYWLYYTAWKFCKSIYYFQSKKKNELFSVRTVFYTPVVNNVLFEPYLLLANSSVYILHLCESQEMFNFGQIC